MATFEEFFAKKNIDLEALRAAKPSLYTEFRQHYDVMGEKSFDHTKKFWFNRLRKSYRLQEEEMAVQKIEAIVSNPTRAEPVAANKTLGFKPKFRANATKPVEPDGTEPTTESASAISETENKPAGFKPRFKSALTKAAAKEEPVATSDNTTTETEQTSKPAGFKPRVRVDVTKVEEKAVENITQTTDNKGETPAKPVRSEPGVTKAVAKEKQTNTTETPDMGMPDSASKPADFKPRFKAGMTKVLPREEKKDDTTIDDPSSGSKPEQGNKPAGFKPRFKAGITKTVDKVDEPVQPSESNEDTV